MRVLDTLIVASVLLPSIAFAGKAPVALRMTLVQAQCPGQIPGPCQPAYALKSGVVELRTSKEPGPTCPKTGQPTELPGGSVSLTGVTKAGSPFTGSLVGEVTYKTTFGTDPNGNCALENVQITVASLMAAITCKNGRCSGTLYAIACLPKECANTPLTTELYSMRVCDGPCLDQPTANVNAIATPGLSVATIATDAP